MRNLARLALTIGATALFAGCGEAKPPVGAVGTPPQSNSTSVGHPDGRWISPLANPEDLLYVLDHATASVMIYSLRRSKLIATITGFNEPESLCVDDAGDVFVPDYGTTNIYEYAHGLPAAL